jgi:hypothetical protein
MDGIISFDNWNKRLRIKVGYMKREAGEAHH